MGKPMSGRRLEAHFGLFCIQNQWGWDFSIFRKKRNLKLVDYRLIPDTV